MSITILTAYDERPGGTGDLVYRAGGTDLQERLRTTGATPHILDLTGVPGFGPGGPGSEPDEEESEGGKGGGKKSGNAP